VLSNFLFSQANGSIRRPHARQGAPEIPPAKQGGGRGKRATNSHRLIWGTTIGASLASASAAVARDVAFEKAA
jgi:hypothetical protein